MGNSVVAVFVVEIFIENFEEVSFSDGGGECVAFLTSCTCFQLRNINWDFTLSLLRAGYCLPSTNDFVFFFFLPCTRPSRTQY